LTGNTAKVRLHRSLKAAWNDPLNKRVVERKRKDHDLISKLEDQVAALQGLVASKLDPNVSNEELPMWARNTLSTKEEMTESKDEDIPTPQDEPSEDEDIPLVLDFQGRRCELVPGDGFEYLAGRAVKIHVLEIQGKLCLYAEPSEFDIQIKVNLKEGRIQPVLATADTVTTSVAFRDALSSVSAPAKATADSKIKETQGKPLPSSTVTKKKETKGAASSKSRSTSPGGPLRASGVPRSNALSDDQKAALKTYFKIEDKSLEAEEWEKLTKHEKSAFRVSHSIPRWAVQAVASHPSNLRKVVTGALTKENFQAMAMDVKVKDSPKKKGKTERGRSATRSGAEAKSGGKDRRSKSQRGTKGGENAKALITLLRALVS